MLDIGSSMTKAGFAGDDTPSIVFPTLLGRPIVSGEKDLYIGDELQKKRSILNVSSPLEGGYVSDWEGFENLLNHILQKELRIDANEFAFLLTEPSLNPKDTRERLTQLMFEQF